MNSLIVRIAISLFILFFALNLSVLGVEKNAPRKKEIYIGLSLPYNAIGGDFTGEFGLGSSQTVEIIMIPKIENGIGFGGMIGYAITAQNNFGAAAEASFQLSSHDYTWRKYSDKASFRAVNVDVKIHYRAQPVEPYAIIGLTFPRLTMEGGAGLMESGNDVVYYKKTDATYSGLGASIGAGLDLYMTPNISLGGRVAYRWISYSNITGEGGKFKISSGKGGSGMHICGMLNYHFPLK